MADTDAALFILAVVFGTRGDIVPILSVLHGILLRANDSGPKTHLLILTHRCFQEEIMAYLPNFVDVIGIDTSPLASNAIVENNFRSKLELDEILSSFEDKKVDLVVSNLFGLEAWGLALNKNAPYIIVHPNCPNANLSVKRELLNEFSANYVKEYNIMCNRTEKTKGVRWSDLDLWLWPTLVDMDSHMVERIVEYDKSVTVLILSSPKFEKEFGWTKNDRYHLCGFAGDGYLSEQLHLQSSSNLHTDIVPGQGIRSSGRYKLCHSLQEVLQCTIREDNEASDLICVDFGSMTQVLHENGDLALLLRLLCKLGDTWRFVLVCHGYATPIQNTLQEISNDKSSDTALNGADSDVRIWLLPNSAQHSILFSKCITIIHHGGIGTTGTCLRIGIPQGKGFTRIWRICISWIFDGTRVFHAY